MKRFLHRITEWAKDVSGAPAYESYTWGARRSYAAWALYHAIFLLRLASPLQHFKHHVRKRNKQVQASHESALPSTLEDKPRPDFHAADTELYLIAVLLLSFAASLAVRSLHFPCPPVLIPSLPFLQILGRIVVVIFLVESIVWTLYYALFRPLIERVKLNLFDEAEYLIMLPVVIVTQTFLLSLLWDLAFLRVGLMILNVGDPESAGASAITRFQSLSAATLGQSYIVIVIASLIRILPVLHVRKRPNITVIGFGDVVRHRILPALLTVYHPLQIAVASAYLTSEDEKSLASLGIKSCLSVLTSEPKSEAENQRVIREISNWTEKHSRFAIIATPTPTHLPYMLQMTQRSIRAGVEKPIVASEEELDLICSRASQELFANTFVFSYYWLEKGLSLNYLLTLNPIYRPLLEIENDLSSQQISCLVMRLGKLVDITLEFLEGAESEQRYWTELTANGGMVFETLIHPMTFVVNLARHAGAFSPEHGLWKAEPTVSQYVNIKRQTLVRGTYSQEIGPTFTEIRGKLNGDIEVGIRCGKYVADAGGEQRYLVARFENGVITTDLTAMETRLFLNSGPGLTISNKGHLGSQKMRSKANPPVKYQHQIDMLNTFFVDGWGGLRFDDYPSQLDVLRELAKIQRAASLNHSFPSDESIRQIHWIRQEMMTDPGKFVLPGKQRGD